MPTSYYYRNTITGEVIQFEQPMAIFGTSPDWALGDQAEPSPPTSAGTDPGGTGSPEPDLVALSREALNTHASAAGVDEPEKLPNKGAVIHAINAADAGDPTRPGEFVDAGDASTAAGDATRPGELGDAGDASPVDGDADPRDASRLEVEDTDLSKLTREDLNTHASAAGVDEPEKLPNKGAVIDAVEAARGGTAG